MTTCASRYLTRVEAIRYLSDRGIPIAKNTLSTLATRGGGPIYRRFGRQVVYLPSELDSWVAEKLSAPRRSTSEIG